MLNFHCTDHRLTNSAVPCQTAWLFEADRYPPREWVTHISVSYITATFSRLKSIRLANHSAHLRQLPYWPLWEQYRGRPPLHPHIIAHLQRQIADADLDLQRGIDADWRLCVVRYPEVLTHFYSMVAVTLPKTSEVSMPNLSGLTPPNGIPPPQLLAGGEQAAQPRAAPPLHRAQTAPPKQEKRERPASYASGALNLTEAELRARMDALMLKEAAIAAQAQNHQGRAVKPKRPESRRNSTYSHRGSGNLDNDDFMRELDEGLGALHLDKPTAAPGMARSKPSRKGRATPGPPTSVADDPRLGRKRRDSAQYLSGGIGANKAPPAAPNAPNPLDQLGILPGFGGRNSFIDNAF